LNSAIEDLKDSEELRAAGRIAFARYWSLFGSGVFSLSENAKDIQLIGKGFQPLRTRLGIGYQDDCLELGLTWRRDFVTTGDARQGDTFEIRFALRNLGSLKLLASEAVRLLPLAGPCNCAIGPLSFG
jgi:LPS-assembly protein